MGFYGLIGIGLTSVKYFGLNSDGFELNLSLKSIASLTHKF